MPSSSAAPSVGKKAIKKIKPKTKNTTLSKRAHLTFSVGRVYRFLKDGNYAKRVGRTAAVYLTAALEYLSAELLELSAKAAEDNDKKIITPRHFLLAVKNDEDLDMMLKDVTIAGAGVMPHIHPVLFHQVANKKKKKQSLSPPPFVGGMTIRKIYQPKQKKKLDLTSQEY